MEHIVREGEHLPGIAAKHGFASIEPIWNHPANAELKAERGNPNVLVAGDRLLIPEREGKQESGATAQRHRFVASAAGLELHVKVHDQGFRPTRGEASFTSGKDKRSMTLSGDIFEVGIASETGSGVLDFPLSKTERQRLPIPAQVGGLDPIDTLSGQQQRLNNLGYFAGFKKTKAIDPKKVDPQFEWAVEEFQCDHMGPTQVDGVIGKQTRDTLKKVYGC